MKNNLISITLAAFIAVLLMIAGSAAAITCTSDTTKTITLGSSDIITVSCTGLSSGDNVEVTHSSYNPGCLTSSTSSKTLTSASPSTTFTFDGLSTACQSNVAERTIRWTFDDGSNTYTASTVVTLTPLEISADFTESSISKSTSDSVFYITMSVSNTGTSAISSVAITETTSTGILDSKTISSISAQSTQSISWAIDPSTLSAGSYSITGRAKAATTDAATDSMTLTITSGSTVNDDDTTTSTGGGGGGGGGAALPLQAQNATGEDNQENNGNQKGELERIEKRSRPEIVPGVGLKNNLKLQAALEKVLGKGKMSDQARENMLRLSAAITADIEPERQFTSDGEKSKITTRMSYKGQSKAKNFIVYEKIPKEFAASASEITISSAGTVEIVEEDPEFAIVFSELNPGDTVEVSYEITGTADASLAESVSSELYVEEIEEYTPTTTTQTDTTQTTTGTDDSGSNSGLIIIVIVVLLIIVGIYVYTKKKKEKQEVKKFFEPKKEPEPQPQEGQENDENSVKEKENEIREIRDRISA